MSMNSVPYRLHWGQEMSWRQKFRHRGRQQSSIILYSANSSQYTTSKPILLRHFRASICSHFCWRTCKSTYSSWIVQRTSRCVYGLQQIVTVLSNTTTFFYSGMAKCLGPKRPSSGHHYKNFKLGIIRCKLCTIALVMMALWWSF